MTPDEIRAEAIERLARAQRSADMAYRAGQGDAASEWGDLSEHMRDEYRKYVEQFVTALGDMLPTGELLGYVVVKRHSGGELECVSDVETADFVRIAEGISAGYAHDGEEFLIAELREVTE